MLTTTIRRLAPRGAPDETAFVPVASVTVGDDGSVTLRGDLQVLPIDRALRDPKTREDVTLAEDPERWARLLPFAMRSSELRIDLEAASAGPLAIADEPSPIAAARRMCGLSARAAAQAADVSQPAWTAAEKRGEGVSLELLGRYTGAIGVRTCLQLQTPSATVLWVSPNAPDAGGGSGGLGLGLAGIASHVGIINAGTVAQVIGEQVGRVRP